MRTGSYGVSLTSVSLWPLFSSVELTTQTPGPWAGSLFLVWFSIIFLVQSVLAPHREPLHVRRASSCQDLQCYHFPLEQSSCRCGMRGAAAAPLLLVPAAGGRRYPLLDTAPAVWGFDAWHAAASLPPYWGYNLSRELLDQTFSPVFCLFVCLILECICLCLVNLAIFVISSATTLHFICQSLDSSLFLWRKPWVVTYQGILLQEGGQLLMDTSEKLFRDRDEDWTLNPFDLDLFGAFAAGVFLTFTSFYRTHKCYMMLID